MTLTAEQQTKVRETVLSGRDVPRVDNVNFSVTVGTEVPSRVRVVEVPQTLIDIHPEWRGHSYFVVHDEIVIVDYSHKVVAVAPVGGSSQQAGGLGGGSSRGSVTLSKEEIRQVQVVLKHKGFYHGEPDGVLGSETEQAITSFQRSQGFHATGHIDRQTVTSLGVSVNVGERGGNETTRGQGGPSAKSDRSGEQNQSRQGDNKRNNNGAGQSQEGRDSGTNRQANPDSSNRSENNNGYNHQGAQNGRDRSGNQPATTGQGRNEGSSRSEEDHVRRSGDDRSEGRPPEHENGHERGHNAH